MTRAKESPEEAMTRIFQDADTHLLVVRAMLRDARDDADLNRATRIWKGIIQIVRREQEAWERRQRDDARD